MFYIFGDIHGYFKKLYDVYKRMRAELDPADTLIFLGDYIDRGPQSYEVVDFLTRIAEMHNTVFLKGNHESMMLDFMSGSDHHGGFLMNGGEATIRSYRTHMGEFVLPQRHETFFNSLKLYYEGSDFIAVHAGLNPTCRNIHDQSEHDLLWIRDKFFRALKRYPKTVIFGHTPTVYLSGENSVYDDPERNILGIDTGVIYNKHITCLRWPDKKVFISGETAI